MLRNSERQTIHGKHANKFQNRLSRKNRNKHHIIFQKQQKKCIKNIIQTREQQKLGLIFNYPNISLIEQKNQRSQFLSDNAQNSLESIDKIIIEVGGPIDFNEKNSIDNHQQQDFSSLHKKYRQLMGISDILKDSKDSLTSNEFDEQNGKKVTFLTDISNDKKLDINIALRRKLQQIKQLRQQHHINKMNHTQQSSEIQQKLLANELFTQEVLTNNNNNDNNNEKQFIQFVLNQQKPINISKIMNKQVDQNSQYQNNSNFSLRNKNKKNIKQVQDDGVMDLLQHQFRQKPSYLQEEQDGNVHITTLLKKSSQGLFILQQLQDDSFSNKNMYQTLQMRQKWIRTRSDKNIEWKHEQLKMIFKMSQIVRNPYIQWSDQEDQLTF